MARPTSFFVRLCALVVLGMAGLSVRAADEDGGFAIISDIHFDPFAPLKDQATSRIGEDTNQALLTSSLATFARVMPVADFAIVPGDLLAHGFNAKAAASLGVDPSSPAVDDVAARTTLLVADALAGTLGGKPAFVALGNEDSKCGDYKIEPGGAYLAATLEAVRRLAGAERLDSDFAETWAAAGYYAARHPTVANMSIVVLNDVVWSPRYQDTCGKNGLAAAETMMNWLRGKLARQRAAGGRVWMVHHIPWGIDAYATIHATAASCPAKVVPFLKAPFAIE